MQQTDMTDEQLLAVIAEATGEVPALRKRVSDAARQVEVQAARAAAVALAAQERAQRLLRDAQVAAGVLSERKGSTPSEELRRAVDGADLVPLEVNTGPGTWRDHSHRTVAALARIGTDPSLEHDAPKLRDLVHFARAEGLLDGFDPEAVAS